MCELNKIDTTLHMYLFVDTWWTNIGVSISHINLSCLVICIGLNKISRNTSSILHRILISYFLLVLWESYQWQCGHLTYFLSLYKWEGGALGVCVALKTTLHHSWYFLRVASQFGEIVPGVRAWQWTEISWKKEACVILITLCLLFWTICCSNLMMPQCTTKSLNVFEWQLTLLIANCT